MGPDESNQWETYGDCSKCRKNNYCNKPCKKNKIAQQILIKRAVINTLAKTIKEVKDDMSKKEELE